MDNKKNVLYCRHKAGICDDNGYGAQNKIV